MYERKIMSHDKQRTDMFGEKSRMPYKETKTFDRSRAQTLSLLQIKLSHSFTFRVKFKLFIRIGTTRNVAKPWRVLQEGTMSCSAWKFKPLFFTRKLIGNCIVNQFQIMTPQGTMGWECKQTSWCADRRHRLVWRARRIFFKTYLKWNGPGFRGVTPCKDESIHINLENSQDSVTICHSRLTSSSQLCASPGEQTQMNPSRSALTPRTAPFLWCSWFRNHLQSGGCFEEESQEFCQGS